MSRQLEQADEERYAIRRAAIMQAVEGGLESAITHSGAVFIGFTVKITPVECLLVLKGNLAGRRQVAFVGSDNLGSALIKASKLGYMDKLLWRQDRYGGQTEGDKPVVKL